MKQQYFIVVLAHSLHGRLRRIHVPQSAVYVVFVLALLGGISLFGMVSSYVRMAWKVANYNALREEVNSLRARYAMLEQSANQTKEQLATLQMFATEVSLAYGIKQKLEGPSDISMEGRLAPTYTESLSEYNFLKSASLTASGRRSFYLWRNAQLRPSIWPLYGRLLSHFGRRNDPFSGEHAFHSGVDISAPTGTPVRATADGVVTFAQYYGGYGKLIVIRHGDFETYYGHLSRIQVVEGQEIRRGEIIGASGATGRVTAPHLHYEVRQRGNPINPYPFLSQSLVAQTAAKKDLPF
jgi:murein DD-endopeptidase MepM/ murein hydrolase activator NlpD